MFKDFYLTGRFFIGLIFVVALFIISYTFPVIYTATKGIFFLLIAILILEILLLFQLRKGITGQRIVADRLSNGDENEIRLKLENHYGFDVSLSIIDEVPFQFQERDINWKETLKAGEEKTLQYTLRPVKRGTYDFGAVNIFVHIFPGFIQRRYRFDQNKEVAVYPSFLQMEKYEIAAFTHHLQELGVKKIRRLGNTMEFEQIKTYVQGDDPRNINWRATSRTNTLMVNTFQDERSQPVYSLIDKGRLMRMPFDGMSLLDYAINASLVISNIALKKQDKAGIITFSDKLSSLVTADKKPGQLGKILEVLYNQKTKYKESNFELLAAWVNKRINHRSLLLLYTNFESFSGFKRQLPYFIQLRKKHLLVVIFFKNTGLDELIESNPEDEEGIYTQVVGEHMERGKTLIVRELKKYGIQSILTRPADLSIDTINKYLQLKARGAI